MRFVCWITKATETHSIHLPTHCATSRMVPGSIPGGVTGNFFRGSPRQNHVPWGGLSPWKWVPGIYPGVKVAGAYGWRLTTRVVSNVTKIRDLNRPATPWACSGLLRDDLYIYLLLFRDNIGCEKAPHYCVYTYIASPVRDFRLPPRNRWELRPSGLFHSKQCNR
jgi:hypothetical protein